LFFKFFNKLAPALLDFVEATPLLGCNEFEFAEMVHYELSVLMAGLEPSVRQYFSREEQNS
jgi:hypothetical protein